MNRIEIGILARTPALGQVKQRLARDIGADAAFSIYRSLFRHTLLCAVYAHREMPALQPVLWYRGAHPAAHLPRDFTFDVRPQPGDDFAANMQAVIDRVDPEKGHGVILIGSDHPGLLPGHLAQVARLIDRSDTALGPTEDGGFWALATRICLPDIFSAMTFSTPTVCRELEARLDDRHLSRAQGPRLFDVDTAADLDRMKKNSLLR